MDDRDRDRFYTAPHRPSGDDDGDELELEPLDPTIVNEEQRRAKEIAEAVRISVNIDDIYRDADRSRGSEILEDWAKNFRFQFQTKHLLIATALLAIVLTLSQLGLFWPAVMAVLMLSVAALYSYLHWQDRKHQQEADHRRDELYKRRRELFQQQQQANAAGKPTTPIELSPTPAPSASALSVTDDIWSEPERKEPFRFQFSLRTLIMAITVAAVSLGVMRLLGGPGPTAMILGFIAVAGLIAHAIGFEAPASLILGWWLILALYVVLSIVSGIINGAS